MNTPVDDKLELLSLSNEDFADGLARMVKLFTSQKDKKEEKLFKPSTSSSPSGNYLLLEDNTPVLGE